MLTIFIYTLMTYGISSALVYYSGPFGIIAKFREAVSNNEYLDYLFQCMFCLPVNIGIIMSVLSMILSPETPFTPFALLFQGHYELWPLVMVFDGFYTGATVKIIDDFVETFESRLDGDGRMIL